MTLQAEADLGYRMSFFVSLVSLAAGDGKVRLFFRSDNVEKGRLF